MDANYYLSREWVLGEYECWAFVCDYYKRELGVDLPLINLGADDPDAVEEAIEGKTSASTRVMFEKIEKPEHNAILELGIKRVTHVGVYLELSDGARVLHCRRKTGGLIQPFADVEKRLNVFGCYRLK